jgi:hypothetical protein
MQAEVNTMSQRIRKDFWERCLTLKEVQNRMTSKERDKFYHLIQKQCDMDFTEHNIRVFILNLVNNYEKILTAAILYVFDLFTKYGYNDQNIYEENIHYFNGWKTNNAFKVGKKVVIPLYGGGYGDTAFVNYIGQKYEKWKLNYEAARVLNDIDTVMNYFDGMKPYYHSMSSTIEHSFERGITRGIKSHYFTVNCYKKGTIHMTFNDEDILRRFNVTACKGKGWLPCNYGDVGYYDLEQEEQAVVTSFEDVLTYQTNLHKHLLPTLTPNLLQIAAQSKI